MGRKGAGRVTAKDVARMGEGGLPELIKQLVKKAKDGDAEAKQEAAMMLSSLAGQNHMENSDALFKARSVPPLVQILSTGSAKAQGAAASALHAIARGKPAHQAAIMEAGGAAPLVRLLKAGSAKVQEEAASALASMSADTSHQKQIIAAGCIVPLVAMLKGGSAAAQSYASQALANAAAYDTALGQNAIVHAGAVPVLIGLLASGKAQTLAAGALAHLARHNSAVQEVIAREGGIAPLLSLLNGRLLEAQVQAAWALSELARDNADTQLAIAKAGGVSPLLALLASRSTAVQSMGMAALAHLARHNRENQDSISKAGGIRPLVDLLEPDKPEPGVQAQAAFALMEISRSHDGNQQLVVSHGGILRLASLMKSSSNEDVKAEVAGALWSLSEAEAIKVAIAAAGTIPPLVALLGTGGERARDHAARALDSLALDNEENQVQLTQLLIDLLANGAESAQGRATAGLWALVKANPSAHRVIANAGAPEKLVGLLDTANAAEGAQEYALWSLSLSINADNQSVVADAGGIAPLIETLAGERTELKEQAASALAKLALDNDETRAAIASQGGVKPLISLLDALHPGSTQVLQRNAADALANLAVEPAARDEIVSLGGARSLVDLLQADGSHVKQFAARALARLSKEHEPTQLVVAGVGAIPPLVLLLDGSQGGEAQQEAAGALLALADNERNRMLITEADGIGRLVSLLACENPTAREHAEGALLRLSFDSSNRALIIRKLVSMLQNTDTNGQEQAAAALSNLARESEENRQSIVDADGIPPLLSLLDSQSSKAKENAVSAVTELCRKSRENQNAIAKVGGIPRVVGVLLSFSNTTMKELSLVHLCTLAASAVKEISKGNQKNQDSFFEAGAIPPLVAMLGSPAAQMQANAAGALANLARNHSDNQAAIARTGAVAPLCTLVREGSPEAKDRSASAIWSLSTDNAPNKDTIAKLGGIDPLLGLLVSGTTDKSQQVVAGALAALASKHPDNRALITKRLVGLLGSNTAKGNDRAVRVLTTCSAFAGDSTANQVAFAKAGGVPPLVTWLGNSALDAQAQAARALLSVASDNSTTQGLIAKSNGISPLIVLVRRGSPEGQDFAARALWHLASQADHQLIIADHGSIKPLVGMLAAEGEVAAELAAMIMVRLTRMTPDISVTIADKGGIVPLVTLLSEGSPGAQQQSAAVLGELALVSKNRDTIANAGGIRKLIDLLVSTTIGTPEVVARVLSHLALADKDDAPGGSPSTKRSVPATGEAPSGGRRASHEEQVEHVLSVHGSDERRGMMHLHGGLRWLISMLDGSNLAGKHTLVPKPISGMTGENCSIGMFEQAAATLADIALNSADMQDAIIEEGGVSSLLMLIRTGSPLAAEHAARAIRNLVTRYPVDAALIENQNKIVQCGTIPELVQLTKTGSQKAQEVAAAGISELASGAVFERELREKNASQEPQSPKLEGGNLHPHPQQQEKGGEQQQQQQQQQQHRRRGSMQASILAPGAPPDDSTTNNTDRLVLISEAGGITPLISMLTNPSSQARENAAGALMHLALDPANAVLIAKTNGIAPLVTILDNGTPTAHDHAAEALLRLSFKNEDNQTQSAKHLVALLGSQSTGAQCRTARVLSRLAASSPPRSPVIIVNAGAISPLVTLLSSGAIEVKLEVADALKNLSLNSQATQLAIATGLVALLANGTAQAQEHVTQLLLTLVLDPDNKIAISKAGAIKGLVAQLRGTGHTSSKAQELSASVLSHLSDSSDENVDTIAAANAVRPLLTLLTSESATAQAMSAAVLSDLARKSHKNKNAIIQEGGVGLLVALLEQKNDPKAKAEAAGALMALATGQPATQKAIADAGAIKLLVALLNEKDSLPRRKAAGAITALACDSTENQDAVEKYAGIDKLVGLLAPGVDDDVRAEAATALAVLSGKNRKNQEKVASSDGIRPLVSLLQGKGAERAKEGAASALWALSMTHYDNQVAIAAAGGIAPLVAVLGLSAHTQEQAAGALASLALDNAANEVAIAKLIVSLLGSSDKQSSAKAARAIARLARAHPSNQRSIAEAGGVILLVQLLNVDEGGVGSGILSGELAATALDAARVQKEMASAIWSMTSDNAENQVAIAKAGGLSPLIALLEGSSEVHRDVAGALWALASSRENQVTIATLGGIAPLVTLLKNGSPGAQETVAGALYALAQTPNNRVSIAGEGGIPLLVALLDGGSEEATEQAAGALQTLVTSNAPNQIAVANEAVSMLKDGSPKGQERVTQLLKNLAHDVENRAAIAKAGAVPELVRQLECGSEKAMGMAASGLALIAGARADLSAMVTQELVKLLSSNNEAVRQRASEALRDMAAGQEGGMSRVRTGVKQCGGLVNLLKDGLKDGRVEAQEYALWSLSSIGDTASKEAVVTSGGIEPLIQSLRGGKLSVVAQEHVATVLSLLAPVDENARSVRDAGGIQSLVLLLSEGSVEAKRHAASTLAQLARRAHASDQIAEAGGVSAFVTWLVDPSLGPPEVAARALSEIALDNPDTQAQIAEEGAILPLVSMLSALGTGTGVASSYALKVVNMAAGALATLAKDNEINQIMITEEGGIAPLITLLKDKHAALKENATKALSHLATNEDNKTAIAKAGGIGPLVTLLTEGNETTQQFTAAALQSLARDHSENQIAIGQAGAITPLANLLGSDARETQEHAVGALLFLASTDEGWRDAVIKCLIGVLDVRSAAAQVKAAEALSILAARSNDNRQAITSAAAVPPLVRLLGDGRRVKAETPQERAACVLADLARLAENKIAIVMAGGISPLVHLLSSESPLAQRHAAGALSQLAAVGLNKGAINEAGAIPPLVQLLKDSSSSEALTKLAASVLWHLTAKEDAKTSMVAAGVIPPLVAMLSSPTPGVRDHAAAVISSLARTSGGSKKAIYSAGGIPPLVELLVSEKPMTQKHAACALWGMSDGKDGVYDKQIAEAEAVRPLVNMMQSFDTETCGFAAACLLCLCKDEEAKEMMLSGGAAEPLLALAHNPSKWLANQAQEMLKLLGIPFTDPEPGTLSPRIMNSPRMGGIAGRPTGRDNQAVCSVAQKTLPIRKESAIDPEMPNPKQGELLKGDFCYVLDRIEVEEGIFRALVATEPAGEPKGWVTAAKEGSEFLIPESAAMMGKDMPNHVKMKFHFFVCQLP